MTINARTFRNRISESPLNAIRSFTGGPSGELYVVEWPTAGPDPHTVSELVPGSGGGGGGGGGKGKKK